MHRLGSEKVMAQIHTLGVVPVFGGNVGDGVTLGKGSTYTSVIDNWIGLNRRGKKLLPNSGQPIVVKPGSVNNKISGNITCCN